MPVAQAFDTVAQKLVQWIQDGILMLPNLAAAVVAVILFWIVARLGRRFVERLLVRLADNRELTKLLGDTVFLALFTCGVFVALGILQLQRTVTSLLTGVGLLGLTVGFALQDIASNLVAGILIQIQQPFRAGDVIESDAFWGRVDRITLRATEMTKLDGQVVLIPNKDIFNKAVINHSATRMRRVDLQTKIAMDADVPKVLNEIRAAVRNIDGRDVGREIELFFTDADDTAFALMVRFWIVSNVEVDYLRAKSTATEVVARAMASRQPAAARRANSL